MKHSKEIERVRLAIALGVAPDDVDYDALINPVLRAARIAKHIADSDDCDEDEDEDELFDLYFAVDSPAEQAAYDRVVDVILKHGGF